MVCGDESAKRSSVKSGSVSSSCGVLQWSLILKISGEAYIGVCIGVFVELRLPKKPFDAAVPAWHHKGDEPAFAEEDGFGWCPLGLELSPDRVGLHLERDDEQDLVGCVV